MSHAMDFRVLQMSETDFETTLGKTRLPEMVKMTSRPAVCVSETGIQ